MFEIPNTFRALAFAFVALSMFAVGLGTEPGGMWASLRSGRRLPRLLAANLLLVPAAGLLVVRVFSPEPPVAAALLLLACTPGGPQALDYVSRVEEAERLAGACTFVLNAAAIFVSPLLLRLLLPGDGQVVVLYGRLAILFAALFAAPAAAGMAFRRLFRGAAARLSIAVVALAAMSATAAGWYAAAAQRQALRGLAASSITAMAALVALSLLAGLLAGRGEGPMRPVFVISTGIRNVAVCLLLALHTFTDARVATVLVAYGVVMAIPGMAFHYFHTARRVGPRAVELARAEAGRRMGWKNGKQVRP